MGLRGPKKQVKSTPGAKVSAPRCPATLNEDGKACWKQITKAMLARQTITECDELAIRSTCEWHERAVAASRLCEKDGLYYTSVQGATCPHAWLTERNLCLREFVKGLARLGLDPTARADVEAIKAKKGSALESFLAVK